MLRNLGIFDLLMKIIMFIYSVNSISVKRELLCKCNTSL